MRLIADETVALAMPSKRDTPDAVAPQTGLSQLCGRENNLEVIDKKNISWLENADGHTRTTQTRWPRRLLNADTQSNPWSPRCTMLNLREAVWDFWRNSSCKGI